MKNRNEAKNLVNIYAGLNNEDPNKVLSEFNGKGFGVFKENLADLIISEIVPIGKEMKNLMKNKDELVKVLINGSEKAKNLAEPVLSDVKKIMGLKF